MLDLIRSLHRRRAEAGASAVEYGLLVALIAAVIVLAVFALGGLVEDTFTNTCDDISTNADIPAECEGEAGGGGGE